MTVVMQEGNVGHMTAVTAVLVARSLRERVQIGEVRNHFPATFLGKRQSCHNIFNNNYVNYDKHRQAVCGLVTKCLQMSSSTRRASVMMGSSQLIELSSSLVFDLSTSPC